MTNSGGERGRKGLGAMVLGIAIVLTSVLVALVGSIQWCALELGCPESGDGVDWETFLPVLSLGGALLVWGIAQRRRSRREGATSINEPDA